MGRSENSSAGQDKKSGKDSNAFRSRMGQQGPKPRLLRLKAEDQALVQVKSEHCRRDTHCLDCLRK